MGKYLSSTLRDDGNASNPTTNQFRGKKLISFKEMVSRPIEPETLKNVLDPADGFVDARHNNSQQNEITGFPITFVLVGCGNSSIKVKTTSGEDHGCGGKIHEIMTGYNLVAAPDRDNPRERKCDTSVPGLSRTGAFDAELFFWSRAMYKTIKGDVCASRHMTPLPPSIAAMQAETHDQLSTADRVRKWLDDHTVPCIPADATDWTVLRPMIVTQLGEIDNTIWAECALQPKHQGRYRSKAAKIDRFYVLHAHAKGDGKRVPRQFKTD
jgi:hypothetical protein